MKAMILAGGFGTCLAEETDLRSKAHGRDWCSANLVAHNVALFLSRGEILLVSDRNPLRDDALYRFVPINPVSSEGDWAKYFVFDLHKQIKKKFTLITLFTNWLSCYAAYCIPLTAQREDTCSATGRVRRAHPTTALAT